MRTEKYILCSIESIFESIVHFVLMDYEKNTGNLLDKDLLQEGFCYTKFIKNEMGGEREVLVTITEFKPNKAYRTLYQSSLGTYHVLYKLKKSKTGTLLVYEETYSASSWIKSLNYEMMSRLYKKSTRKNMLTAIQLIEEYAVLIDNI